MSIQTEFHRQGANRGFKYERTKWERGDLEKAFADHWEDENEVRAWLNQGHGLLQNLFFDGEHFPRCTHVVTPSERYVAATVIQWLGTNCGFAFLQECLRECGYYITEIPKHEPLPEPVKLRLFGRRII